MCCEAATASSNVNSDFFRILALKASSADAIPGVISEPPGVLKVSGVMGLPLAKGGAPVVPFVADFGTAVLQRTMLGVAYPRAGIVWLS
jgi:hypothetical protein